MKFCSIVVLSNTIAAISGVVEPLDIDSTIPMSFVTLGALTDFDTCFIPFLNKTVQGGCQARVNDYNGNSIIEIYKSDVRVCATGVILPLFPSENMWSRPFRAIVYFIFLSYLFLGIAIASDIFMGSIEVIKTQEKTVKYQDEEGNVREKSVVIWNETVANLTLMALGSSAPEIILATWETIVRLGKPVSSDGLGAGTIVGSAAYNLLMIIAICVYSIPDGESRHIKAFDVFLITAAFSFFAYIWLYLALAVITPGVVDIYEALITFAFFPLLIVISYMFDIKLFVGKDGFPVTRYIKESVTLTRKLVTKIVKKNHKTQSNRTAEDMANEITQGVYDKSRKSSLFYRINAVRSMKAGKRVVRNLNSQPSDYELSSSNTAIEFGKQEKHSYVFFSSSQYAVSDSDSSIIINVTRNECLDAVVKVDYETGNGTAKSGAHYGYTSGTIEFAPNETKATISIPILGISSLIRKCSYCRNCYQP
jgi:solute carrier family 8 (sodium/calcium exchanger)